MTDARESKLEQQVMVTDNGVEILSEFPFEASLLAWRDQARRRDPRRQRHLPKPGLRVVDTGPDGQRRPVGRTRAAADHACSVQADQPVKWAIATPDGSVIFRSLRQPRMALIARAIPYRGHPSELSRATCVGASASGTGLRSPGMRLEVGPWLSTQAVTGMSAQRKVPTPREVGSGEVWGCSWVVRAAPR